MGEDHKNAHNYKEINAKLEGVGKMPSSNLITKWLKPKGMPKSLEEIGESELKRVLKKQEIFQKKKLINLRIHYNPFYGPKPPLKNNIENDIHQELFETDLQRSSTYLDLIEELETESRINTSMNKSGSEYTPTGIKHAEVIIPRGSHYRMSPQNSVIRSSYKLNTEPSFQGFRDIGGIVNSKLAEIESLIVSANMNHDAKNGIMQTISSLKAQITSEIYAPKTSKSRTPEKPDQYEASPLNHNSGHLSSKSCADRNKRKPLLKIHQNQSSNYIQNSNIQRARGRHFKSITDSGKKPKKDQFDLSFLANHNFSNDIITAFQ